MIKKDVKIRQRIAAFLLALVMIVGVLPIDTFASAVNNNEKTSSNIVVNNKNTDKNVKSDIILGNEKKEVAKKYKVTFNPNGGSGGGGVTVI